MVVLTEFGRTTTFTLLENTIEITEIVEAAVETDLGYGVCAINKHPTGIPQSKVNDILTEISPCMEFKETTKGRWTHTSDISHLRQTNLITIILVDEILHLLHSAAIA